MTNYVNFLLENRPKKENPKEFTKRVEKFIKKLNSTISKNSYTNDDEILDKLIRPECIKENIDEALVVNILDLNTNSKLKTSWEWYNILIQKKDVIIEDIEGWLLLLSKENTESVKFRHIDYIFFKRAISWEDFCKALVESKTNTKLTLEELKEIARK